MSSGMLRRDISCRFIIIIIIITAKFMTRVTCRLTAKNWDQLQNPTLGNRVRFMTMQVGVVRGVRSLQWWSCDAGECEVRGHCSGGHVMQVGEVRGHCSGGHVMQVSVVRGHCSGGHVMQVSVW